MQSIKGKIAVITGASKGIGLATAEKFATQGANLVLVARSHELLNNVTQKLKKYGVDVISVPADLTKAEEVEKVFEKVKSYFQRVDILVNNAGRGIFNYIEHGSPKEWKEVIDLNLTGLIHCTHMAVKMMIPQRSGHIVNISSVAGRVGIPGWSVYCATKWAVVGFSESIRKELIKYNIRVTVIEPGVVTTEWGENMPEEWIRSRASMRALKAVDVAEAIYYVVTQPEYVSVNELLIRPTEQER
ncbi:NADP-dependent 3-hydroxy acid dehydrogenase YdfG [Thermodesulfovibrio aggregans]|uniref:NADP-dependent 3-hydroxy acid dehydrogenase YdfG n=1 Tax=Thermodesulfovibrio aggregans TaxID=86166 RepID=A0A0U9HPE4_9BACT|nr:SDR family oxidoreductase [Thermodesulfovibrio aggregans]GAQ94947.1 NADP-dependent 3-hydroxy acid dehydrogenase YdfG [Thermodesulfovibrio aggregans]